MSQARAVVAAGRGRRRIARGNPRRVVVALVLFLYLIAGPRRHAALALHYSVERLEIRSCSSLRKKLGCLHGRDLLGYSDDDELIYAGSIFSALLFHRLLQ